MNRSTGGGLLAFSIVLIIVGAILEFAVSVTTKGFNINTIGVILLIVGLTIGGKVVFGAIHGILPVALLTMAAIRNIPPVYLKSARTLHLSPWQTIVKVLLPATLPEVASGLRIGFTVTLFGVLLSEMFASRHGLGFLIVNAMALLQTEEMITVAIVLFVFAAAANALLLWMERQMHRRV